MVDVLIHELRNFMAKISTRGHDSYGAAGPDDWRESLHDDTVLAVALAVWWTDRGGIGVWTL